MKWIAPFLLIGMAAHAAPPPNANPAYHEWFEQQWSLNKHFCCNESDGHILNDDEWRTNGKDFEVQINGKWYPVPKENMVDPHRGGPNPTGHAVVWYLRQTDGTAIIFCFAQGFEG